MGSSLSATLLSKRQSPPRPQASTQRLSKGQNPQHPSEFQTPPAFWDNLPKICLTKRALKELDRRAAEKDKEENQHQPAVGYLEEIKLFARHGGPDLSDLRGCQEPANPSHCNPLDHIMGSNQSIPKRQKRSVTFLADTRPTTNTNTNPNTNANTATTGNTSPYDRNFQLHLIHYGVYPDGYEYPDGREPAKPNNWEEINQRLAQHRPSLSLSQFPEEAYRQFVKANKHASKEDPVTKSVIPVIEGKITDNKCVLGKIPFTNLDHLTNGTLVRGNPDLYYSARPEQLNRQICMELSNQIIPSTQLDLSLVPNFFLEAKGPDGSVTVARRQASYNGALGARGMHCLQSYKQDKPTYNNNAYTITSTYHDGQLKLYTSYPAQPNGPGSRPEYYMHELKGWSMASDPEAFRQGATAFRNARDWAKEQRDEAIRQANNRANGTPDTALAGSALASGLGAQFFTPVDATPLSIAAESQNQESLTTQAEDSYMGGTTHQESGSAMDRLRMDFNLPAKRPSGSLQSRQRKRVRGASTAW